jgi:hypothetical protein
VTRSREVVISRERVNLFVENEVELGILDTDDQTSDKQSTAGQREQAHG